MKQITLLISMLIAFTASAATGWYNDFLTIKVNGVETTNNYYLVDASPASGASALHGADFGTVTGLELTAWDMKYWSDTQDRVGGALYYKIMNADGSTQIVTPTELMWEQVKLTEDNDYQGIKPTATSAIDFLQGLPTGTYQLHVWAKSWGTEGGQGDSWLSNGGLNYVASFSVYRPVIVIGANGIAYNSSFATLKAAFDAINAQPDQAGKDIEVQIAGNTTETAGAALFQPTTASWNSLTIYPTAANVAIKGDFAGNLIDLNGADNVTITGKLNKTGDPKNLTIENMKSGDNGARTIRIWNDATFITITHSIIKGSNPSSGAGVFFISNTTGTTGNDDITISYNDFNMSGTSSPYSAIYAAGQSGKMNDKIVIDNNNFFNLFNGETFFAIRIGAHNSEFTISNNNIYEPNEITPTAAQNYNGISITGTGEMFNIINNNIGGNAPGCVGTLKKGNAFSNQFVGLFVSVSTSSSNGANINGNVIKNIEWKNAAVKKDFTGMQTFGNAINIGGVSANIISDIVWENGAVSDGVFYGINCQNTGGLITAENNIISNISINNTESTHGSNFYGLFKSNSAGSVTFMNNTINNINATGTSTANNQILAGAHLNYVSGTIRAYTFDISGNTFSNINNASARTDAGNSVHGIFANPPQGSGTITKNKIFGLTASDASLPAQISGINMDVTSISSATVCANNMISLGNTNPGLVYGILQNTGLAKVYHNSVNIAGAPTVGSFESSALNASGSTAGREFVNNVLINARSNAGTADGKHYTVKYAAATDLSSNYNVVNYSGIGGALGMVGATEYATGESWTTGTGLDTDSKVSQVNFSNLSTGDLTITGLSVQDINLKVPSLTAVTTDILGTTRNTVHTYAGAHEAALPFPTTAVEKISMDGKLIVTAKGIEIRTTEATNVEIFSVNGLLLNKAKVNGLYTVALDAGVYIVRMNETTRKIVK